jgi:hypothetical protein
MDDVFYKIRKFIFNIFCFRAKLWMLEETWREMVFRMGVRWLSALVEKCSSVSVRRAQLNTSPIAKFFR